MQPKDRPKPVKCRWEKTLFKIKNTVMRKIKIWWLAVMCDYPFYRVVYKDGLRTRPLHWSEANGLKEVFNGKMFIDYEYGKEFLDRLK